MAHSEKVEMRQVLEGMTTVCLRGHEVFIAPASVHGGTAFFGSAADFCSYKYPTLPGDLVPRHGGPGGVCEAQVVRTVPRYVEPPPPAWVPTTVLPLTRTELEAFIREVAEAEVEFSPGDGGWWHRIQSKAQALARRIPA